MDHSVNNIRCGFERIGWHTFPHTFRTLLDETGGGIVFGVPKEKDDLRRFWQWRFYDFNVYTKPKMQEKLDYMHANPGKRRLVKHPKNWPWSSFSFHATGEPGLISLDILRP